LDIETIRKIKTILSRQVVLFGGEYGRCKSLSLTALAYYACVFGGKQRIVSNMPLKNLPSTVELIPLIQTSQFDLDKLSEISHSLMIWDEMFNDVKARSPMSENNKYISQLGVGFRKDKINLLGSLQYARTIDISIDDMTEMKIIPTLKNLYSTDSKEDIQLRLKARDFVVFWDCLDVKGQDKFKIEIDLFPFLNNYNTNFKPYKLALSHRDYLEKLELQSKRKFETMIERLRFEIPMNKENWEQGLSEIP